MPQDRHWKQTDHRTTDVATDTLIALGSNQYSTAGSPKQTLERALALLTEAGAVIRALSPYYHTPAFPAGSGPDFVNAAAVLTSDWTAEETLAHLHQVEAALGRERLERWGQRTLDLDLIAQGCAIRPDLKTLEHWISLPPEQQQTCAPDQLLLPHPRMQDRAFVLVPLAQIAPDWVHPVLEKSVSALLAELPQEDLASVREIE